MNNAKKVVVIGAGFAGLAAASVLAKHGYNVMVFEKNDTPGGRARQFSAAGFTFDMGPSWYWMPEVFEDLFHQFDRRVEEYYDLRLLDPGYQIYYGPGDMLRVPADPLALPGIFEKMESGSGARLRKFLKEAAQKYDIGMRRLVYKPGLSLREFADRQFLAGLLTMNVFGSLHRYVRKYFRDQRLIRLMEFPVLFLGGMPQNTPALYSLMNHAALQLGTWYPMGGIYKIVAAMVAIANELGVEIVTGDAVCNIAVRQGRACGVQTMKGYHQASAVIATADYSHVESSLLDPAHRTYDSAYWDSRILAPSSLIFYLGIDHRVPNLEHHTLFFDEDLDTHAREIYVQPQWPTKPLFYACCPSKTDPSVAPEGCENLFLLMPLAPGLEDTDALREHYFEQMLLRLEKLTGHNIRQHIVYKRCYCLRDFQQDYNALKGNAYGLANTLKQTAILKPSLRSKKVANLLFAGQLTVPGPGVPPSLISGQVAAREALKYLRHNGQAE